MLCMSCSDLAWGLEKIERASGAWGRALQVLIHVVCFETRRAPESGWVIGNIIFILYCLGCILGL